MSFVTRPCTTRGSSGGWSHSRPGSYVVSRCSVCDAVSTTRFYRSRSHVAIGIARTVYRVARLRGTTMTMMPTNEHFADPPDASLHAALAADERTQAALRDLYQWYRAAAPR